MKILKSKSLKGNLVAFGVSSDFKNRYVWLSLNVIVIILMIAYAVYTYYINWLLRKGKYIEIASNTLIRYPLILTILLAAICYIVLLLIIKYNRRIFKTNDLSVNLTLLLVFSFALVFISTGTFIRDRLNVDINNTEYYQQLRPYTKIKTITATKYERHGKDTFIVNNQHFKLPSEERLNVLSYDSKPKNQITVKYRYVTKLPPKYLQVVSAGRVYTDKQQLNKDLMKKSLIITINK